MGGILDIKDVKAKLVKNPVLALRLMCQRKFFSFLKAFWPVYSSDPFKSNWHIELMCAELQQLAEGVANWEVSEKDLVLNVPPGSTKTACVTIMFPVWCWTRWPWMRFITLSYSSILSLESAEYSRDLIRSVEFKEVFPELEIKADKDTKGNFRIQYKDEHGRTRIGGNRFSTSVGGTATGFHAHIIIIDDPLNPHQAASDAEIKNCNDELSQTLSTRKVDKAVTATVLIQQRLHQNDPTGYKLENTPNRIKHICLPGEIRSFRSEVQPPELIEFYKDDLLDPVRLPWSVLEKMKEELGQYGYSGQVGQKPVPPGGGMFHVDSFQLVDDARPLLKMTANILGVVRYWDKAGTEGGGAYTAGVKMYRLEGNRFLVTDVKRGQWATHEREKIIRQTAEADGADVVVYHEQEPGSGGKESVENTIRNLAGFVSFGDRPTGDKVLRADPYSVQVNNGNVMLLSAPWTGAFLKEHRFFPYSTYKDQVDAASGAFSKLTSVNVVQPW